jgi:hypothetical protein
MRGERQTRRRRRPAGTRAGLLENELYGGLRVHNSRDFVKRRRILPSHASTLESKIKQLKVEKRRFTARIP